MSAALGVTRPAWAQNQPAQTETAPYLTAGAAYAEAAHESDEVLYKGVVKEAVSESGELVLLIDRIILPSGKKETVSPARRKTVRLTADLPLRSADASDLVVTRADLVPGSRVFVLGTGAGKGAKADAIQARTLLVPVDGGDLLPGSLLKPWNSTTNWTFRANANAAPNSEFSSENGALHIKVGGKPVREWHAQIFQQATAGTGGLEPGKKYTIRFQARADTRHFLTVGSETDTITTYKNMGLLETVLLTPRWQVFQHTFTVPADAAGPIRLPEFSAAHRGGDVYLANIALVAGEPTLPPTVQNAQARQIAPNTNLIDDANDPDAWLIYSEGSARGNVDAFPGGGKVLRVTIQSASTQAYHLQLLRPALPLVEGRTYVLEFLARASQRYALDVEGQTTIGDFHNIGLSKTVDLDNNWKMYTVRFIAKNVVPGHSRAPQFCFGKAEGIVWLANVSLKMDP